MFDLPSPSAVLPVAVNDVAVIEIVGGLSSSHALVLDGFVSYEAPGGWPPPPTK